MDLSTLPSVTGGENSSQGMYLHHLSLPPYLTMHLSFGGSAGQAIVTRNSAYLITDSRYWLQASAELDHNWQLVRAGTPGDCRDWIEWLVVRRKLQLGLS